MPYSKKSKTVNGPDNNKAYMPVPKGYKGNWNVPKGTPWKKDSPYNPANAPSAKKAAEAKSQRDAVAARRSSIAATKKAQRTQVTSRAPSPSSVAAAKKRASVVTPIASPSGKAANQAARRAAITASKKKASAKAKASAARTSASVKRGVKSKLK